MNTKNDDRKRTIVTVVWLTLLFATLGLATQLAILLFFELGSLIVEGLYIVIPAVASTFLFAFTAGFVNGRLIHRRGMSGVLVWVIGVPTGWICLFVCAFAGSFASYLKHFIAQDGFQSDIMYPVWIFMYLGTIPAIILGLAYSASIRYLLRKQVPNPINQLNLTSSDAGTNH